MNTKDLLKEAIADAKAVRETALAQAKLALEEAFTPRLQSMFAAKLQEMEDDEMKEAEDKMDEAKDKMVDEAEVEEAKEKMEEKADMEEFDDDDNSLEEIDLDEILAELDEMDKDELKEAKEEEEIEAEEDVEDEESNEEEDEEENKEVSELTMDELEELIRDIVSQEMEPGDEDELAAAGVTGDSGAELPDTTDDEVVDIEEVNLDEILAELLDEETTLTEGKKRNKYGGNKGDVPASKRGDKKDTAEEEGVEDYKKKKSVKEALSPEIMDLIQGIGGFGALTASAIGLAKAGIAQAKKEIVAKLKAKGENVPGDKELEQLATQAFKGALDKATGVNEEKVKMEKELEEAIYTVHTLRHELQEVNLLNAKLLYVNKLFKAKNLTESQKIKVVQAFDKAESAKEAKLVYESLSETFAAKAEKTTIKESLGFASKAAGVAPQKQVIVESNEWIARMQKLANIK
jgi:hypothetical protein